jgi:hypothetical protein
VSVVACVIRASRAIRAIRAIRAACAARAAGAVLVPLLPSLVLTLLFLFAAATKTQPSGVASLSHHNQSPRGSNVYHVAALQTAKW